jgi:predicted transcriptional regulator
MKVKEVMHKGVDWVDPDTPVSDLAKLMRQHDIGAIPIGQNDRLIGMVTDRQHEKAPALCLKADILRSEEKCPLSAKSCRERRPSS